MNDDIMCVTIQLSAAVVVLSYLCFQVVDSPYWQIVWRHEV